MKKKLSRIVGVAVSVALVASLCVFAFPAATPVEAAPGKQQWSNQTLPSVTSSVLLTGSNVADYAVASDGLTIYVANDGTAYADASVTGAVLRSTDGGQSFTALTVASSNADGPVSAIAVAPDDPNVVAVVEFLTTACVVHITVNGGSTWTALPVAYASPAVVGGNSMSDITDIDVGPARSGTVFGREYVVSFADPVDGRIVNSDVQIIGELATWASIGNAGVCDGQYDYMSVKMSPGFVGDRVVALVGSNTSPTVAPVFQLVNSDTGVQISLVAMPSSAGLTSTDDYETTGAANATSINSADIALPSDFDPALPSMRRAFASYGSQTAAADNDVYRIDDTTRRDLDAVTTLAVKSIAYTGIIDEGTLFMGEYASNNVKYALDPWVSIPSWKSTKKAPSPVNTISATPMPIVRVSPVDPNVVFAGTSSTTADLESAFSVSTNAAVSFNAESLIDHDTSNTVLTVDDIYITPDGGTIFMATNDGAHASLWKSATPTNSTSWSRVYVFASTTACLVRLNPDYADTPGVYYIELTASGDIFVSSNGSDTFSPRTAPSLVTPLDVVVENATTLYLAAGANVYTSTNSAWTWETPKSSKVSTPIISLAMAPSYPNIPVEGNLLVGGTDACSYSTDGGTTFTKISGGLTAGSAYQILAHEDYADNNTIYCGDDIAVGTLTYRFVIGESTSWENLIASAGALDTNSVLTDGRASGLAMTNGVLYVSDDGSGVGVRTASTEGVRRSLYPTAPPGDFAWESAAVGTLATTTFDTAPSALRSAAGSNTLYAIDTVAALDRVLAYSDLLATAVPILTAPADGYTVSVDPVSGRALPLMFSWEPMGSGTGLVNMYRLQIAEKAVGFVTSFDTGVLAVASATSPAFSVGPAATYDLNAILKANTEYVWRIQARDQVSNDGIRCNYSEVRDLLIEAGGLVQQPHGGPIMLGPTGGAVDVTLTPGFSWAPIAEATEYQFILATDAGLVNTIAGTPATVTGPAFQVTEALEYGTVYFWAVKSTSPTVSPQSIGSFTTMAAPVVEAAVWTCMQCGLQFDSEAGLEAHIADVHKVVTPFYMWAIIAIGAVLVIVVIVLITRTRRVV